MWVDGMAVAGATVASIDGAAVAALFGEISVRRAVDGTACVAVAGVQLASATHASI